MKMNCRPELEPNHGIPKSTGDTNFRTIDHPVVKKHFSHRVGRKMAVQLGFLEPLEWSDEAQNDFSISRLGGLPVQLPLSHSLPPICNFDLKLNLVDMAG